MRISLEQEGGKQISPMESHKPVGGSLFFLEKGPLMSDTTLSGWSAKLFVWQFDVLALTGEFLDEKAAFLGAILYNSGGKYEPLNHSQ